MTNHKDRVAACADQFVRHILGPDAPPYEANRCVEVILRHFPEPLLLPERMSEDDCLRYIIDGNEHEVLGELQRARESEARLATRCAELEAERDALIKAVRWTRREGIS